MSKKSSRKELMDELINKERKLYGEMETEEEILEVNYEDDGMLEGKKEEDVETRKMSSDGKVRKKNKKGKRYSSSRKDSSRERVLDNTDQEEEDMLLEGTDNKGKVEVKKKGEEYSLTGDEDTMSLEDRLLREGHRGSRASIESFGKRRVEDEDTEEDGGRKVRILDSGLGSVRKEIRELKDLIDDLEDEGGDRKKLRIMRKKVDRIGDTIFEWVENRSKIMVEVQREIEKTKEEEREKEKQVVESVRQETRSEKWLRENTGEVKKDDVLIQLYDGKESMTVNDVKEGLREDFELAEEVEIVRKMRDRVPVEEGACNLILKVPPKMFVDMMSRKDKKVCIGGQWLRYAPYVSVQVCWRCLGYGHFQGACSGSVRCRRCGGGHLVTQCTHEWVGCAICVKEGLRGEGHRANTMGCPLHRALLERRRKLMEEVMRKEVK